MANAQKYKLELNEKYIKELTVVKLSGPAAMLERDRL